PVISAGRLRPSVTWRCTRSWSLPGADAIDAAPAAVLAFGAMIFTSESALVEPSRHEEWDAWYRGHLAAMAEVPGVLSAQRLRALERGVPPSLALYTVISAAVFDSEIYHRTRGMGPGRGIGDETQHRRNLFDG